MSGPINRTGKTRSILLRPVVLVGALMLAASAVTPTVDAGATQARSGGLSAAQAPTHDASETAPSFEVASIKPHVPDNQPGMRVMMGGPDVGRFTASNVTAKMLIATAYSVKDFQISGGPSWINSDRFDIDAKVEDSLAEPLRKQTRAEQQAQTALMIRSLLLDRFKLQVTRSTKEGSVLALVVAKGGPKLTEVPAPDPQRQSTAPAVPNGRGPAPGVPPPGGASMMVSDGLATLRVNAAPMTNLVNLLSLQVGREVVDQTGLKGFYEFTLQFAPQSGMGGMPPAGAAEPAADSNVASIFTALEEQLGLKLEDQKAPVDTITIDHIEEPSEN